MELKIDENELNCPITNQLMTDPTLASDGFTYEYFSIATWMKNNKTSPMTREILGVQLTPNKLILSLIEKLESNNPSAYLYMKRYQYNFIDFIKYYQRKSGKILDKKYDRLLIDLTKIKYLPNNILNTPIHSECQYIKNKYYCRKYKQCVCVLRDALKMLFHDNFDFIVENINVCQMPQRKLLYILIISHFTNTSDKKVSKNDFIKYVKIIIKKTSPDDDGIEFFLKSICNYIVHCKRNDLIQILFDNLDPLIHYKFIKYQVFKMYFQTLDSINQLDNFMLEKIKYFDSYYYKYTLHCVLSNNNLMINIMSHISKNFSQNDTIDFHQIKTILEISSFTDLFTNSNILSNILDPCGKSIVYCLLENLNDNTQYSDIVVKLLNIIINHNISKNNISSEIKESTSSCNMMTIFGVEEINIFIHIAKKYNFCKDFFEKVLKLLLNVIDIKRINDFDIEKFIVNFFKNSNCGISIFIEWIDLISQSFAQSALTFFFPLNNLLKNIFLQKFGIKYKYKSEYTEYYNCIEKKTTYDLTIFSIYLRNIYNEYFFPETDVLINTNKMIPSYVLINLNCFVQNDILIEESDLKFLSQIIAFCQAEPEQQEQQQEQQKEQNTKHKLILQNILIYLEKNFELKKISIDVARCALLLHLSNNNVTQQNILYKNIIPKIIEKVKNIENEYILNGKKRTIIDSLLLQPCLNSENLHKIVDLYPQSLIKRIKKE